MAQEDASLENLWQKSIFHKSIYLIGRAGVHVAAILLFIVMLAIVVNSIERYVFGGGIHLIIELGTFTMLFVVFLGLAGTHLVAGHVSVDLLLTRLSDHTKDFLRRYVIPVISLIYVCLLFYVGMVMTYRLVSEGTLSTGTTPFPLGIIMAVMPFGCLLLIVVLAVEFKAHFSGEKRKPECSTKDPA